MLSGKKIVYFIGVKGFERFLSWNASSNLRTCVSYFNFKIPWRQLRDRPNIYSLILTLAEVAVVKHLI